MRPDSQSCRLNAPGGQAQFIVRAEPSPDARPSNRCYAGWNRMRTTILSLAHIAAQAGMSTRTLSRRVRAQTGTTPLQWLQRSRVRGARYLRETTSRSLERIGEEAGFGAATTPREVFQ